MFNREYELILYGLSDKNDISYCGMKIGQKITSSIKIKFLKRLDDFFMDDINKDTIIVKVKTITRDRKLINRYYEDNDVSIGKSIYNIDTFTVLDIIADKEKIFDLLIKNENILNIFDKSHIDKKHIIKAVTEGKYKLRKFSDVKFNKDEYLYLLKNGNDEIIHDDRIIKFINNRLKNEKMEDIVDILICSNSYSYIFKKFIKKFTDKHLEYIISKIPSIYNYLSYLLPEERKTARLFEIALKTGSFINMDYEKEYSKNMLKLFIKYNASSYFRINSYMNIKDSKLRKELYSYHLECHPIFKVYQMDCCKKEDFLSMIKCSSYSEYKKIIYFLIKKANFSNNELHNDDIFDIIKECLQESKSFWILEYTLSLGVDKNIEDLVVDILINDYLKYMNDSASISNFKTYKIENLIQLGFGKNYDIQLSEKNIQCISSFGKFGCYMLMYIKDIPEDIYIDILKYISEPYEYINYIINKISKKEIHFSRNLVKKIIDYKPDIISQLELPMDMILYGLKAYDEKYPESKFSIEIYRN